MENYFDERVASLETFRTARWACACQECADPEELARQPNDVPHHAGLSLIHNNLPRKYINCYMMLWTGMDYKRLLYNV